jgi:pimeloyl-ACP methyl ester carboxylesterase
MRYASAIFTTLVISCAIAQCQLPPSAFAYQKPPVQSKQLSSQIREGVRVSDLRITSVDGSQIPAYLVEPRNGCSGLRRRCAGILMVHWYDSSASNANRSEFLPEAYDLARHGAVSLLVDAMWAQPGWLEQRNRANDYNASVAQVKNLRRSLDVLVHRSGVDPSRVAVVGHDFGAMFGAIVAGVDHRVRALVLMAGDPCLSDRYLVGQKLSAAREDAIKKQLSSLCPVLYLPRATGPVFLQYADKDPFVSHQEAQLMANAAPEPKRVRFYDLGHELNRQARIERMEWLMLRLHLRPSAEQ